MVLDYLDAYFDDVLTMLETMDMDVLAHLTCPLRYINGKNRMGLDIERYSRKIDRILKTIIEKGIALEVNTSSVELLFDVMPSQEILGRYHHMGGTLLTLRSDAHRAEDASRDFEKALDALRRIGFEHIYYYVKRKPYPIKLS